MKRLSSNPHIILVEDENPGILNKTVNLGKSTSAESLGIPIERETSGMKDIHYVKPLYWKFLDVVSASFLL